MTRNPNEIIGNSDDNKISKRDMLSPFEIAEFAIEKINLTAIIKLRNGPMKVSTFKKLMKGIFPKQTIDFDALIKILKEKGFIEVILDPRLKEPSKDESNQYILLIKDILSIRKPSSFIQDKLLELNLPNESILKYTDTLKAFFKKYTMKGTIGDDPDVFQLYKNHPQAISVIEYLKDHIVPLKSPPIELLYLDSKSSNQQQFEGIIQQLADQKYVYICEDPTNPSNPWVILLTAVDLYELFPEYMINGVVQQLQNKTIDKEIAVTALNVLKKKYIEWNPCAEYPKFPEEDEI